MSSITAIIITYNEEKNIEACLSSIKWADEIIIVDSNSSDNTVNIAKKFTDIIISTENISYGSKKNLGIEKASSEWILWLDADERISPELAKEIEEVTNLNDHTAYYINRKSFFINKFIEHCGWYPDYTLRLFKSDIGLRFDSAGVHEKLDYIGKTWKLKNELFHYTDMDYEHYIEKLNNYTSLSAEELKKKNRKAGLIDIIFRPVFTFLKMYFFRLGILDGYTGLILCVLSSYHTAFKYIKNNSLTK